jgi:cytochrome b involved in lipid metabolism
MAAPATTLYSLEEISRHSTRGDSWLVIDDGVYDVSKFAAKHPGGSIIFQHAGGDATDAFHAFHLENTAARMLPSFKIGEVKDSRPVPPHVRDFRLFRQEVEANGYMKADLGWFLKYFILVCCIYAAGVMVPLFLGRSWLATMLSGTLVCTTTLSVHIEPMIFQWR